MLLPIAQQEFYKKNWDFNYNEDTPREITILQQLFINKSPFSS